MKKDINITDIQNGKQALLCLRFVFLRKAPFILLNDEYKY